MPINLLRVLLNQFKSLKGETGKPIRLMIDSAAIPAYYVNIFFNFEQNLSS